jgi:hypothetical protein
MQRVVHLMEKRRILPRLRRLRLLILGLLLLTLLPVPVHAERFSAHEIKAIFLFNFSRFVNWPKDAFDDASTPFQYCAFGDRDLVIDALEQSIAGETIDGRAILLKKSPDQQQIKACHILFIGKNSPLDINTIIPELTQSNVLTVSGTKGFVQRGGMMELANESGRIKLLVNTDQLDATRLVASSKLLRMATRVSNDK